MWYQIKHGWIKKVEIVSKCAKKRLFKWDETIEGSLSNLTTNDYCFVPTAIIFSFLTLNPEFTFYTFLFD